MAGTAAAADVGVGDLLNVALARKTSMNCVVVVPVERDCTAGVGVVENVENAV